MEVKVLSHAETAFVLRQALGPFTAWSYTLADMRRDRTSINGIVLKPVCKVRDGGCWVPAYASNDIARFIRDVSARTPEAKPRVGIQTVTVEIDPTDGKYWKMIRAKPTRH
jgi:hypothetical protein